MESDGYNSPLSPVVYGDIALSINTQYNTIELFFNYTYLGGDMHSPNALVILITQKDISIYIYTQIYPILTHKVTKSLVSGITC